MADEAKIQEADKSETRRVFFVWRRTSRGAPSPAVYIGDPPGHEDRRLGPPILAEHDVSGLLPDLSEYRPVVPWALLAAAFPPPVAR